MKISMTNAWKGEELNLQKGSVGNVVAFVYPDGPRSGIKIKGSHIAVGNYDFVGRVVVCLVKKLSGDDKDDLLATLPQRSWSIMTHEDKQGLYIGPAIN